jgi:hypothetical protein
VDDTSLNEDLIALSKSLDDDAARMDKRVSAGSWSERAAARSKRSAYLDTNYSLRKILYKHGIIEEEGGQPQ